MAGPMRRLGHALRARGAWWGFGLWQAAWALFYRAHGLQVYGLDVPMWHRLPDVWLQGRAVWASLWVLHMQPPLWNAFYAALLRLPANWREPLVWLLFQLMAWHMLVMGYRLLRAQRVPRVGAAVGMAAWLLYPEFVAVLHTFKYTLPVMWLLVLLAWTWQFRPRALPWPLTGLALLRATYGWPFLALVLGWAWLRRRWPGWRAVLIPLGLLGLWSLKNGVLFGLWGTTSSWFGMNWLRNVRLLYWGDPQATQQLLAQGVDPIIQYPTFAAIETYPRAYWADVARTCQGPPALCSPRRPDAVTHNFNYIGYIPVSRAMARAAAQIWWHNPGVMLRIEQDMALDLLLSPAFYILYPADALMPLWGPWVVARDAWLCPSQRFDIHHYLRPPWDRALCPGFQGIYLGVLAFALGLMIVPWSRPRRGSWPELALLVVLYAGTVYTLVDFLENARMRLEVDALWWLLALWVGFRSLALARAGWRRARRLVGG